MSTNNMFSNELIESRIFDLFKLIAQINDPKLRLQIELEVSKIVNDAENNSYKLGWYDAEANIIAQLEAIREKK